MSEGFITEYESPLMWDEKWRKASFGRITGNPLSSLFIDLLIIGQTLEFVEDSKKEKVKGLPEHFLQGHSVLELKEFFGNAAKFNKWDQWHTADKSKDSHVYANEFIFKNQSKVGVHIYDWSNRLNKEKKWHDHISVAILSKEYSSFLKNLKY